MKSPAFEAKQLYKNRAEAYRLFIQAQGLPVGQTKFYNDAERLKLIGTDKSIELASLLAYIRNELQIDPSTGQSLVEKDREDESRKLDLDEKRLKIAKLEREGRKDDREYIKREVSDEREGALIGTILGELRYQATKAEPSIILLVKGDTARRAELHRLLEDTIFTAFRAIYESNEIDITFAEEEEQ